MIYKKIKKITADSKINLIPSKFMSVDAYESYKECVKSTAEKSILAELVKKEFIIFKRIDNSFEDFNCTREIELYRTEFAFVSKEDYLEILNFLIFVINHAENLVYPYDPNILLKRHLDE